MREWRRRTDAWISSPSGTNGPALMREIEARRAEPLARTPLPLFCLRRILKEVFAGRKRRASALSPTTAKPPGGFFDDGGRTGNPPKRKVKRIWVRWAMLALSTTEKEHGKEPFRSNQ